MRNRTIIRDMADRPDTVSIRPSPEISAFAPRALPHSSIRPTRYGQGANDTPVRPAFRNTAELKINIEGQPILLRFFLDGLATGVPPRSSGSVPDINSLLSITLEKIADRIRRSAGGGGSSISNSLLASGDMGAEKDSGVVSLGRTLLRVGPLELNLLDRTAKRGNRLIDLRPREFRLLRYMMERSDKLLTRAALLRDVWNYKFVPQTNLVDVHMGRLRRKVDGPGEAPMIRSVRGAGFVLNAMPLSISRRDRPEAGLSQFNR